MKIVDKIIQINDKFAIAKENKEKTRKQQEEYINSMTNAADDIDRSYNQYLCQRFLYNTKVINILEDIAAFFCIMIFKVKIKKNMEFVEKKSAVCIFKDIPRNVIPKSLGNDLFMEDFGKELYFDSEAKKVFGEIRKKYPKAKFFQLKNLIKLAMYAAVVKKYNPEKIICSCEYSFTSSILTYYCELKGIQHVNMMHGEKIYDIKDSFCRFHRMYIWDEYYIGLFKKMKWADFEFVIELPESMLIDTSQYKDKEKVDYKFYLQLESEASMEKLKSATERLEEKGCSVMIRPHPKYTNVDMLEKYVGKGRIEDYRKVSIEESLSTARVVISKFSTVLNQSYHSGIQVMIDDFSNPEEYTQMKDKDYIMFSKEHLLLSEVLNSGDKE